MYQTSDIRNGLKIEMDGYPWEVVYFQFVKPGKGTAFTRVKLKNMMSGNVIERTYRSGETLEPADVETNTMQYLYNDGENYYFMNQENFEQMTVPDSVVGDKKYFLLDEAMCQVMLYKERPVNIEVPTFVELQVVYTEPGAKGNTASSGSTKTAEMNTGGKLQVPLFIEQGEWLRVDTRTGSYVERVKK